jgi:hypothetical protein
MHVDGAAVMMGASGAGRTLPRRQVDGAHAETDEHDRHAEFEEIRDLHRQLGAQQHDDDPDGYERERVTEAPAGAEERGLVAAAFAADERRHGREMIRFERVAHAEQRAEARAGHEFENWHGVAILPEIPRCTAVPTARGHRLLYPVTLVGGGVHL